MRSHLVGISAGLPHRRRCAGTLFWIAFDSGHGSESLISSSAVIGSAWKDTPETLIIVEVYGN